MVVGDRPQTGSPNKAVSASPKLLADTPFRYSHGRTADPFVEDSTTFNRYTCVHNNPLSLRDPTGYFSTGEWAGMVGSVAISMFTGGLVQGMEGWAAFGTAVAGGAAAGAVSTGSTEGALWCAFSAMAFSSFGEIFDPANKGGFLNSGLSAPRYAARSLFHGLSAGMLSGLQGGKFGHGFVSAGFSSLSSGYVARFGGNRYARGAIIAIVGGTASELSGLPFHYHIRRYNWYRPWTWFRHTRIIKP